MTYRVAHLVGEYRVDDSTLPVYYEEALTWSQMLLQVTKPERAPEASPV